MGIFCMAQEAKTWALCQSRGGGLGLETGAVQREGVYAYLWVIHIEI